MALGPCGTDDCLYFADIGDNLAQRSEYAIHRVKEPILDSAASGPRALEHETIRFTYPDGSHDAEPLVAHPAAGALYVVTKAAGASEAWALSTSAPGVQTARHVGPAARRLWSLTPPAVPAWSCCAPAQARATAVSWLPSIAR